MRWLGVLLLTGCASRPILFGSNWERICYNAPYETITPDLRAWLRREGVVEQRGWTITPEWLNANCDTVPGARRHARTR